jgi:hypothetical protein
VQTVAPAPTGHQTAGELVDDDDDLTRRSLRDDVVDVAL